MFYRLKQLIKAISPRVTDQEYQWLSKTLNENEYRLFCKQPLAEQRHSLDVFYDISKDNDNLNHKDYQTLMYASLFHDCGKSLVKIHLWQRAFIVIINKAPDSIRRKLLSGKTVLAKTIIINNSHPSWGKHLASKAGLSEEVQIIIESHHNPVSSLDKMLFNADRRQ